METNIIDIKQDKRFYAVAAYGNTAETSSTLFYFSEDGFMYQEPYSIPAERIGLTISKVKSKEHYDPFCVEVSTETTIIKKYHRTLED